MEQAAWSDRAFEALDRALHWVLSLKVTTVLRLADRIATHKLPRNVRAATHRSANSAERRDKRS